MGLLQVFFIISGVIIFLLALDVSRRERFNALHFLVFLSIGAGLLTFTFFPPLLDIFASVFGVQRGADVLVYTSIVFLLYFVLLLLQKAEKNRRDITRLSRHIALERARKPTDPPANS